MNYSDNEARHVHADVRYEPRDLRFGCLLALLIVGACFLALHFTVIWYIYRNERSIQAEEKKSPYPIPSNEPPALPPEPRLEQIDRMANQPAGNLFERQAAMEKLLHSSGPTSEKGFMHIPIEEAMRKIVGQLPVRKQSPDVTPDAGTPRGPSP